MSKTINILITCSGGRYTYDLANSLKALKNFKVNLFGVDLNPKLSLPYIKKQYSIPNHRQKEKYFKRLFSICRINKIKIILPLSENESILFSKHKSIFDKKKIKISTYFLFH